MNLQEKLIKSLERTIELQEGLIAEQEAHIQELEREVGEVRSELALEQLKKVPNLTFPDKPIYPMPPNPLEPYGPVRTGTGLDTYTISSLDEKEKTVQKGSGSKC